MGAIDILLSINKISVTIVLLSPFFQKYVITKICERIRLTTLNMVLCGKAKETVLILITFLYSGPQHSFFMVW